MHTISASQLSITHHISLDVYNCSHTTSLAALFKAIDLCSSCYINAYGV